MFLEMYKLKILSNICKNSSLKMVKEIQVSIGSSALLKAESVKHKLS
jgi:hypothetical protein